MMETETTDSKWFEGWFNSPYYHLLYRDRDENEAQAFIDELLAHLIMPAGSRILDLACGAGRHSIHLHSKGFQVTGIDLSEESILKASQSAQSDLEFYVHDMRSLFWSEHFDLVVNLFTSFGYFHSKTDDLRMLQGVHDALKPEGRLVIDFMNAEKVIANLIELEDKEIDGVHFSIKRKVEDGIIIKTIEVTDDLIHHQYTEEVDALTLEDFQGRFEEVGLKVQSTFGDYRLNAFDAERSDRLIMIVGKA